MEAAPCGNLQAASPPQGTQGSAAPRPRPRPRLWEPLCEASAASSPECSPSSSSSSSSSSSASHPSLERASASASASASDTSPDAQEALEVSFRSHGRSARRGASPGGGRRQKRSHAVFGLRGGSRSHEAEEQEQGVSGVREEGEPTGVKEEEKSPSLRRSWHSVHALDSILEKLSLVKLRRNGGSASCANALDEQLAELQAPNPREQLAGLQVPSNAREEGSPREATADFAHADLSRYESYVRQQLEIEPFARTRRMSRSSTHSSFGSASTPNSHHYSQPAHLRHSEGSPWLKANSADPSRRIDSSCSTSAMDALSAPHMVAISDAKLMALSHSRLASIYGFSSESDVTLGQAPQTPSWKESGHCHSLSKKARQGGDTGALYRVSSHCSIASPPRDCAECRGLHAREMRRMESLKDNTSVASSSKRGRHLWWGH